MNHAVPSPLLSFPFSVVTKPTGATCNLDCTYCYFVSKELLYPKAQSMMSLDVLDNYVRQVLESASGPEGLLLWQGGEPTMRGLKFYRTAVKLADKYRRPGQRVTHAIQTNGTLLDDKWCAFFKEHDFLVGLSVDGPREVHDAYRVNRSGRGTFDLVIRGWELLRKHEVDTNILATIHAANQDHPLAVYRFLRDDLGADFLQFIPIVERVPQAQLPIAEAGWRQGRGHTRLLYQQHGDAVTSRSVTPGKYGQFLTAIFDEWVRRDMKQVYVQLFDATLATLFGQYPLCVHAPECGTGAALAPGGDLYSCDHYVEPAHLLGNIAKSHLATMMSSKQQREFGATKRSTLPTPCLTCPVRKACNGGCPKDRFRVASWGEEGLNYLCEGYLDFFTHVQPSMIAMAQLLQQGRSPTELMNTPKNSPGIP